MFLGNIVSEQPITQDGLFYVTNNIENIKNGIPTLIIGWDFTKRILCDRKLLILDKNIDKNINWTFSKKERRIDYEKDLKNFIRTSVKTVDSRIKYKYVNILTQRYTNVKNIIKKLTFGDICYIYICKNSFVYVYFNESIIGIDLNSVDFLQIERKKVYKILYGNGNKVIFSDDFLPSNIRENIEGKQRIIPYLYSIGNDRKY